MLVTKDKFHVSNKMANTELYNREAIGKNDILLYVYSHNRDNCCLKEYLICEESNFWRHDASLIEQISINH